MRPTRFVEMCCSSIPHAPERFICSRLSCGEGRLAEAVDHASQAVRVCPLIADYWNSLGILLGDVGKYDEAIAAFDRALQQRPDYPEAHANRRLSLLRKGDLAAAERAGRDAVRLDPGDAMGFADLARALGDQGKLSEALEAANHAADLRHETATPVYSRLAAACDRWGDGAMAASVSQALQTAARILRPPQAICW